MADRHAAFRIVRDAIGEVNLTLDKDKELATDETTPLVGSGTSLDSLALVNLIVAIDSRVYEVCGAELGLVEAMDADPAQSPLRTIGTLIDYVAAKL